MNTRKASADPSRSPRPSIWSRPERGSRGPTPAHTREMIVVTATALADADGLTAVSMRGVAAALGTGAGSLYRYLSSRDDLLDLMSDAVVAELRPYPDPDHDWLESMLRMARGQLALHQQHPWLLDLAPRLTGVGPESLAWLDACLAIMAPLPGPVTTKFEAIAMMTGVVNLVARQGKGPSPSPFEGRDLAAYPHLVAALSRPAGRPPTHDLFERTLRILLTGLLADPRAAEQGRPTGAVR